METVKTYNIHMPNGSTLTLDMSRELLDQMKEAFQLHNYDEISEDHIKAYLITSMRRALESETEDEEE